MIFRFEIFVKVQLVNANDFMYLGTPRIIRIRNMYL